MCCLGIKNFDFAVHSFEVSDISIGGSVNLRKERTQFRILWKESDSDNFLFCNLSVIIVFCAIEKLPHII